ncbi:MAG: flagellar protein FliS [Clostridia bacterium]|nr:flagellar protein FliS [Clostridia bacterium]
MEITTARVVNSSQLELVTLSYEVILDNLKTSLNNINEIDLKISKAFLKDLSNALDMKYEISKNLKQLYNYVDELLVSCEISNDENRKSKYLNESIKIITKLYDAYNKIVSDQNEKEKVMENTDAIYSGLTYGMNGLNETVVGNYNRGLKV